MGMPVGGNLVVPLVLWGNRCPSHTILSMTLSFDQKALLTGSAEGQICLWDLNSTSQMVPQLLFYGHTGSITSLTAAGPDRFVSSDDTGELCLWDMQDDQCLESKKSDQIHSSVKAYKFEGKSSYSLLCNGHYPQIHILNADSLEIIYSLVARVHPDWVNAFCLLRPLKRQDDVILAVTCSGTIKMWTINVQTVNSMHIYEDESKQIRCVDAKMIRCCPYNQRTVLIICSKYWQIYDAGEFSLLCSENASKTAQWSGGQFIAIDKIIVWNSDGQAFLYKLPTNSNPEHRDYHHHVGSKALQYASPALASVIVSPSSKILPTPSVFVCEQQKNGVSYMFLRADADSSVHHWSITGSESTNNSKGAIYPTRSMSLTELWSKTKPLGLLDRVQSSMYNDEPNPAVVTCSVYIEHSCRLVCGQTDGDIVIVPIMHTVRNLLFSSGSKKARVPMYRVFKGHKARVNCLLYPHSMETRYNPNHLLSGSSDFSVCLWDLVTGQLLHTFSVHAGEVTQFYIPPDTCNSRILSCICSVANDHSVALISLKEKRPLVFASRHMFPVQAIKWRPVEDFMVISCTDSTAYIWQMETGLLDRVVHGVTAVEMLKACGDGRQKSATEDPASSSQISISQALRRRNLATFKNLAQQALQGIENLIDDEEDDSSMYLQDSLVPYPKQSLTVQSIKWNTLDADSHVLFFDTEALIIQLLRDEFGSSSSYEPVGKDSRRPQGELEQKITDFFSMVKDKAEGIGQAGYKSLQDGSLLDDNYLTGRAKGQHTQGSRPASTQSDRQQDSLSMEIAQMLLSLTHAWSLDSDLDTLCVKKLGLERLDQPVSFGLLSTNGHAAFMLPKLSAADDEKLSSSSLHSMTRYWEVSCALTTQHLLSVIALTNTLMSMVNASFVKPPRSRKHQHSGDVGVGSVSSAEQTAAKQSQIKQGWSLLAALHCILLPDLVNSSQYRGPQLHLLASRWQDRCLEVREASQALLLAELRRIGCEGRRTLIRRWAPSMPNLVDDANGSICLAEPEYELVAAENEDEPKYRRVSSDKRRLEATAIVMLGVIGAEFGADIDYVDANSAAPSKSHSLAWHTSKALSYLLLNPRQCKLSVNAPIRRAAIDLLGRGFSVWQPYIDVSAILLGLLEICVDAEKVIPSGGVQSGLPLTPAADTCRTARHALSSIATAQPATFLTCMAKEVARYNAAAQNPQSGAQLHTFVLMRAKSEMLRVIETLIDKLPNDVAELLTETMDVAVHCLDTSSLKQHGLQDTFPSLCKFPMVSYCANSRRICVGSKQGTLAFYEIKQSKAQSIPFQASPTAAMIFYLKPSSKEIITAHRGPVAAASFSDDGKYLASYSPADCKVNFWQTSSSSLFGSQHTRCIKTFSVPWKNVGAEKTGAATKAGRLTWSDQRTVSLILPDGTESRYRI